VAEPSVSRANNRMQYLFLNGRYIRDRSLQHALGEAYRGLLLTGRFPVAFLRLEMSPEAVDVNVHPTKLEVRFQDGGRVYSQILGTLRSRFLSTDLTVRVRPPGEPAQGSAGSSSDPGHAAEHRQQLEAWARGAPATPSGSPASEVQTTLGPAFTPAGGPVPEFKPFGPALSPGRADGDGPDRASEATPPPSRMPLGLQLHDRYLVTEDDAGMIVIDQHALHERILYEQLRETVLGGEMETQRLLVPEPVALSASDAAAVLEARETLARLGIEVAPFGGDTVLISSYPAMLANMSPEEVLRQVVDLLVAGGKPPERADLLDELLHMIACKAAIKAGDRLSLEEVQSLLEQRHQYQDTHHCPHGRPTALVFTREELDRRFKRT
jgi:DNA mismatch repair protein MutL